MYNNRICLTGNLTKNPEYSNRPAQSGKGQSVERQPSLVHFRIAVNETVGDSKEETIYMNVDGRGSHAHYARNVNLSKGDRVMVVGRLKQKEHVETNGVRRTNVTVIPSTFSKLVRPVRTKPSDEKQGS
tara:strand:- start:3979 stop:4365 length:387 start_codon:yes stop_codon:yes gene_type:complete